MRVMHCMHMWYHLFLCALDYQTHVVMCMFSPYFVIHISSRYPEMHIPVPCHTHTHVVIGARLFGNDFLRVSVANIIM